jgi:hypothetical protein
MVTAIYSLSRVHGAGLWLLFWLVCAVVYLGISFLIKDNRTKKGVKNVLIGLLIAEVVIDLLWAIIYYHNGTYLNYGIGAVYGLFLWIPILAVTLIIITIKNKKADR